MTDSFAVADGDLDLQGFDQVFAFSQHGINARYGAIYSPEDGFFPTELDLDDGKVTLFAPKVRFFLPAGAGELTKEGQIGLVITFKPHKDKLNQNPSKYEFTFLVNTGDPVEVLDDSGHVMLSGGKGSSVVGQIKLTDTDKKVFQNLFSHTDSARSLWAVIINFNNPDNDAGKLVAASEDGKSMKLDDEVRGDGQNVWEALKKQELQLSHYILAYQVLDIARPTFSTASTSDTAFEDGSSKLSVFQTNLTCTFTQNEGDGDLDTLNLMLVCNHKQMPASYKPLKNLVPDKVFPGAFYLSKEMFLEYYLKSQVMMALGQYVLDAWPNNKSQNKISNPCWGPLGPFVNPDSIKDAFWVVLSDRNAIPGAWDHDGAVQVVNAEFEVIFIGREADLTNSAESGQLRIDTLGVRNIGASCMSKQESEETFAYYEGSVTLQFTVLGDDTADKGKLVTSLLPPPPIDNKYFRTRTQVDGFDGIQGDPKVDSPPHGMPSHYSKPDRPGLTDFESEVMNPHLDDASEIRFNARNALIVLPDMDLSRLLTPSTKTFGKNDPITLLSQRTFLSGCSGYNFKKVQFTQSKSLMMLLSFQA